MRRLLYIPLLSALFACSSMQAPMMKDAKMKDSKMSLAKEADEKAIANCTYKGSVFGTSTDMAKSKVEALAEATGKGASHVMWITVEGGKTAAGNAYKC